MCVRFYFLTANNQISLNKLKITLVGLSIVPRIFKSVVLPPPELPRIIINYP